MAHKIEGYTQDSQWARTLLEQQWPNTVKATLVIGEKAYTHTEVKELIRGMMELLDGDPEQVLAAIEAVNAKHGLGLSDPA